MRNETLVGIRGASLLMAACVGVACTTRSATPANEQLGAGDSLYRVRLSHWLRDSVVLDSMTRLVRTDSLYALYRRALDPGGVPESLVTAVVCEERRLGIRYGAIPSRRAISAMQDTVYADHGIDDGLRYFTAQMPNSGMIIGGRSVCGPNPPAAPRMIGVTPLDTELPPRPQPPTVHK
jgi:hypothetical protein